MEKENRTVIQLRVAPKLKADFEKVASIKGEKMSALLRSYMEREVKKVQR